MSITEYETSLDRRCQWIGGTQVAPVTRTQVACSASGVTDLPASERKADSRRADSWAGSDIACGDKTRAVVIPHSATEDALRLVGRARELTGDLAELAGGHIEDEPARRRVFGDERAVLDAMQ